MKLTAVAVITTCAFLTLVFLFYLVNTGTTYPPQCREGHWEHPYRDRGTDVWVCDVRDPPPGMKLSEPREPYPYNNLRRKKK
jgi:hypothetical protein